MPQRIDRVDEITDRICAIAGGAGTSVGTGGMRSKIEAARIAMRGGVPVFVGKAREPGDLLAAVEGDGKGTYFDTDLHTLSMKKQWIGFHSDAERPNHRRRRRGKGAGHGGTKPAPRRRRRVKAISIPATSSKSSIRTAVPIGRGVVNYASWQVQAAAGLSTEEVRGGSTSSASKSSIGTNGYRCPAARNRSTDYPMEEIRNEPNMIEVKQKANAAKRAR